MRRRQRAAMVVLGATAVVVLLLLLSSSGAGHGDTGVGVRRLLRAAVGSPLAAGAMAVVGDPDGDGAAHKSLWPLDRNDVVTLVLATLGLVIASGGGTGGGGRCELGGFGSGWFEWVGRTDGRMG